jgi:hypothetical protein
MARLAACFDPRGAWLREDRSFTRFIGYSQFRPFPEHAGLVGNAAFPDEAVGKG